MGNRYNHLDTRERTLIKLWLGQKVSLREMGRRLNRNHSTISRELKRNLWCGKHYYIRGAQFLYARRLDERAQRFRLKNHRTRNYVIAKLKIGWTPEIISGRLKISGQSSYVCHESIYQYIYIEAKELIQFLPRKHTKRHRKYPYRTTGERIKNRVSIDKRPAEASSRSFVGHWESDSVVGGDRQFGLNVLVERATRLTNISILKNKSATETKTAIVRRLSNHPLELRQSITYDNGSENVLHQEINIALNSQSYFCQPYHSWEKGSVEQINGLIRREFPKGTDFSKVTPMQIYALEKRLNNRPRKCLNYKTPYEAYTEAYGALTH